MQVRRSMLGTVPATIFARPIRDEHHGKAAILGRHEAYELLVRDAGAEQFPVFRDRCAESMLQDS